MLARESYENNQLYIEEFNLVLGLSCGSAGIRPCHRGCENSCISDSGDVLCGEYMGHTEVTVTVTGIKLYTVRCQNAVSCNY